MGGQRPPQVVRHAVSEVVGPCDDSAGGLGASEREARPTRLTNIPDDRSPAVTQYVHATAGPPRGFPKVTEYPLTVSAMGHPDTDQTPEDIPADTTSIWAGEALPPAESGHWGSGIAVGAGSGVAGGTQALPVQLLLKFIEHVFANCPCPLIYAGSDAWKHLL